MSETKSDRRERTSATTGKQVSENLKARTIGAEARMRARVLREAEAFMRWLRNLPRNEREAFLEFYVRELFPEFLPPCGSPFALPDAERNAWADEFGRALEASANSEQDALASHRAEMELWRRWLEMHGS